MANAVETPSQNNLMTEGSIVKSLLLFALPLIFGNLLQQLYNTADSIIVGNFVGANALAAVGSSGSPIYLLIGFSQGLAVGAGVVVSQFLGAKDHREAQEAVHTSLAIAVIMGLLLTVGGIACGRALLVAMNTPAEVLGDAVTYIRIYFGGVLFSVVYNMTAGILNAAGNSRRSLIYLAWASVTNIVLDLVFIVIFRMGVAGAAIATDISQLVSCVLSLRFLIKSTDDCRVIPREIRLHKKMAARIIRVGLPTGIQNMVISFSNVLVQASVNSYGAAAMAGFAAYMKIDGFNILPVSSISMAATTFVGQNYGAGRLDRVKKGTWVTLAVGVVYTLITGTLLLGAKRHSASVYPGRGGGGLWGRCHAVVLPLLLFAQHPPRSGRCGARHRSQHSPHGGAAGVLVPVPHRVDPVGAALLPHHRRSVHPLPCELGPGGRSYGPVRLEGQVDGISRMKKAPLTCGQGSFLVTAFQTARTGMRCRWSAPAGRPDGPHRRGAFSSNRGSWRTVLPAGRGAP